MKTRLQRFLADCGVASRRQCEEMILAGRVRVNGEARTEMPVIIDPETDVVTVDDEQVAAPGEELKEQEKVYFLLNKPKGILVTNNDPAKRKTVGELMTGVKQRIFPVGRLDMDSRGALIMTNDGELANRLTHPRFGIEKTYIVEVDGRLSHDDIEKVKRGMWLGPERPGGRGAVRTERFHVKLIGREHGRTILEVKLTEAQNREIRRVMARIGHNVRDLNRVAIGVGSGRVTTKGLDVGKFRVLSENEVKWLYKVSSPEFHDQARAATQAWYENKEMEKERKRLSREPAGGEATAPVAKPHSKIEAPKAKVRERPARKGRKPFIPPTGRNAGKVLGGSALGRRRVEQPPSDASMHQDDAPDFDSGAIHPLGDDARSEE